MEVSAFMTEQLKAQVVEQRAHDNEQHVEMIRLLVNVKRRWRHSEKSLRQS
jgi:hypothetical protein